MTLTVTNSDGQTDTKTVILLVYPIPANISIKPETINLRSHGTVTVFITLPEGYDVTGIDATTVHCEGITAEKCMFCDDDPLIFLAKFDRNNFANVPVGYAVELNVSGKFTHDGYFIDFKGSDVVTVVQNGMKNP